MNFRYISKIINWLPRWVSKREYKKQQFNHFNERPVEYAYLFRMLNEIKPRTILDVGTGRSAMPSVLRNCGYLVTALDKEIVNKHYHIIQDDITKTKIREKFDVITCISVLEHIPEHKKAIENMLSLLNPNGKIIITFPYNEREYVENVYKLPASVFRHSDISYTTQSFSRNELRGWGVKIIDQEYWEHWTGKVWSEGRRINPLVKSTSSKPHQLTCMVINKWIITSL